MFPEIFGVASVYTVSLNASDLELIKGLLIWGILGLLALASRCTPGFRVIHLKPNEGLADQTRTLGSGDTDSVSTGSCSCQRHATAPADTLTTASP